MQGGFTTIQPFDTYYDVAVLGGGLCGISAALALTQAGKKVLLIERRPLLGWEITSAFKTNLERKESPAVRHLHRAISAVRGLLLDRVDPPVMEVLLDQLVEQHDIDLLLYSQPTELLTGGDRVTGVVIGNKQGEQTIRADAFVDATEEALLWKETKVTWQ
jgi:succinate dehydrogenase/fumarate reductase flavoprotein subunit